MIFDFNIPWAEFRFRVQILCAEKWQIFKFLQIDLKIPWWKSYYFIYKHFPLVEIGKMPRQGCWKLVLFGHKYRDYYDNYPTLEELNGQKISTKSPGN